MRKIVAYLDDSGNLIDCDKNNTGLNVSAWSFDDAEQDAVDVAKLMSLGATSDDLLKLKASGVI